MQTVGLGPAEHVLNEGRNPGCDIQHGPPTSSTGPEEERQ